MKPHLQTTIWTLLRAGNSQREIERRTGISRHTIRAWAKRFEVQEAPPDPPDPPPASQDSRADGANCPGVATDPVGVRLALRARIVLLAASGWQNKQIAEELAVGRVQVARWRQRYLQGGLQAIERDLPRGAPPTSEYLSPP